MLKEGHGPYCSCITINHKNHPNTWSTAAYNSIQVIKGTGMIKIYIHVTTNSTILQKYLLKP